MNVKWAATFASSLRSIVLVSVGVVVGSLVVQGTVAREAPAADPAATSTRWLSCVGMGFFPHDSSVPYGSNAAFYRDGPGGYYHCAIQVPDRATITQVRFTVFDTRDTGPTGPGYLGRVRLDGTSAQPTALSNLLSTTAAGTPGRKVLTDSTITNGLVDNQRYAYWLECYIPSVLLATGDAGIFGGGRSATSRDA